jgi:DUF4097 and DUF4098 domain-containing protein YvlB
MRVKPEGTGSVYSAIDSITVRVPITCRQPAAVPMKSIRVFLLCTTAFLFWVSSLHAQDISRSFDVSPGSKLVLTLKTGGDVVIRGWERDRVEASVAIRGRDANDVVMDFDQSSKTLEISSEFASRRSRANVSVEVRVPSRFDLDVSTTGGDLEIYGVTGTIEGSSMGGDLVLSHLGGQLDLSTMGGDIGLTDSEVDGSLHTMGGDVAISDVTGNIDGTTMGGDVTYDNVRSSRSGSQDVVRVSSMGGDVVVDEALHGADVHTMGGDVQINRAANYVKAGTMGGDIVVSEIDGWIEANTMGGDIEVNMVGGTAGDRHVELESMGGTIVLTVPPRLSMDIDIRIRLSHGSDWDEYEIVSDFDLKVDVENNSERRWRTNREVVATGRVGNGGNKVVIRTVNGNVVLKRGR